MLANRDLLRIYFYDASPAKDKLTNPIDGSALDLSATQEFRDHMSLLDTRELTPNFAVRRGELVAHGWKLGSRAFQNMMKADPQRGIASFVFLTSFCGWETGFSLATPALSKFTHGTE